MGQVCLLSYSLPGTVDYPWSTATSISFTYNPNLIHTSAGTAIQLLNGSATRTYTNRFGDSFVTPLSLLTSDAVPAFSLLYLNSSVPVDDTGLTFLAPSPLQLPGAGPMSPSSVIQLYNSSNAVVEEGGARVDPLGQAYTSSIPGFNNVTIGANELNSLALSNYSSCQAPLTFTNGMRQPTQPSSSNGAALFSYSYDMSDGLSYTIQANLTLFAVSAFANTRDSLGNPYLTLLNITGTRLYVHLPSQQRLLANVTGLAVGSPASQRFYPYSLLDSAPSIYTPSTAPFLDGNGMAFTVSPPIPVNGLRPGEGPLYNSTTLSLVSGQGGDLVLSEMAYITLPLLSHQLQSYRLL